MINGKDCGESKVISRGTAERETDEGNEMITGGQAERRVTQHHVRKKQVASCGDSLAVNGYETNDLAATKKAVKQGRKQQEQSDDQTCLIQEQRR